MRCQSRSELRRERRRAEHEDHVGTIQYVQQHRQRKIRRSWLDAKTGQLLYSVAVSMGMVKVRPQRAPRRRPPR